MAHVPTRCLSCNQIAPVGMARCSACQRAYDAMLKQSAHDLWVYGNNLMESTR